MMKLNSNAQGIAVNSTGASADSSAMMDVSSTTKGLLIPRMTTAQRNSISNPASSLLIFNTSTNNFEYYDGSWKTFMTSGSGWETDGNSGVSDTNHFVGTTDKTPVKFRTNNSFRMCIDSLGNVGIGSSAPDSKLNVEGSFHTHTGNMHLYSTDEILPGMMPGLGFAGSTVGVPGASPFYLNGILHDVNDGSSMAMAGYNPYSADQSFIMIDTRIMNII